MARQKAESYTTDTRAQTQPFRCTRTLHRIERLQQLFRPSDRRLEQSFKPTRKTIKPAKANVTMTGEDMDKRTQALNAQPAKVRDDDWSQLLKEVGDTRNEQAFARLFQHFAPLIKGFCISNGNQSLPGEAAEELVQEVMVKVWLKSPSFDPAKAAASTWIFTVMRNCRIDMLRRNSRHQINQDPIDVDEIWDDSSANEPFVRLQQARHEELVKESFSVLPVEQKQVLAQVYMQGKSHSEIAEESGLPLGTVKSRVRMGLKKLHTNLARRY